MSRLNLNNFIGIKISNKEKDEIGILADNLGISKSALIRAALKLYIKINLVRQPHKLVSKINSYIEKDNKKKKQG